MALTEQSVDPGTGTTHHGDKMMQMCEMMEHCCAEMSDEDKKKMMQDMMPRMMHMMGDGRGTTMMETMHSEVASSAAGVTLSCRCGLG